MWSDPLSETANNQWVVCDPRNLWPTSKVCFAQSSGKVANKDVTITFLATSHKLRHISTSGWMISNILSIIHVCGQANSPNPNLYNFRTMKVWSDFTTMTHISDTKSYISSKYMFHHILVTHGYEIHIHIPDSTQFKCAFNHFAVCSKRSLPMSMNQFTSGELTWLQPISGKSANVFSTQPNTSFKPVALYQSIPLLCLSNGSIVLSIAILFLSKKTPFKSPRCWTQTTNLTAQIKQSQVVGALKKYCDRLPQFNSKGIPPEPASMHYPPSMASQCHVSPTGNPPACPLIRPYFLEG